jgi:hypothetical protein
MAFFKRSLPTGILIGVAAGLAARELFPRLGDVVKPISKVTVRGGILAYEKMKEAFAHVGETLEDLASEVKTELAQELSPDQTKTETTSEEPVPMRKTNSHASPMKEAKTSRETSRQVS